MFLPTVHFWRNARPDLVTVRAVYVTNKSFLIVCKPFGKSHRGRTQQFFKSSPSEFPGVLSTIFREMHTSDFPGGATKQVSGGIRCRFPKYTGNEYSKNTEEWLKETERGVDTDKLDYPVTCSRSQFSGREEGGWSSFTVSVGGKVSQKTRVPQDRKPGVFCVLKADGKFRRLQAFLDNS